MNKKVYVKYKNLGEELGDDFEVFSESAKAVPESTDKYELINGKVFEIGENEKYINILPLKYDLKTYPDDANQKFLEGLVSSLNTGLVSFHKLNDATDSINFRTLSNNGNVEFGQGFFGKSSAAYFNGLNFLKTNYSQLNSGVSNLADFSISFFMSKNEFGSENGFSLIDGTNSSATKTSFYIREREMGLRSSLLFGVRNPNNTFQQAAWDSSIFPYTTYHIAAVRSNGILKLYVNGEKVAESTTPITNTVNPTSDNNFAIGARLDGTKKFSGRIGSLGIWNRELSENEIFNLSINAFAYEEDALPYTKIPLAQLNVNEKFTITDESYAGNPIYKNKYDYYAIWKSSELKKWVMTPTFDIGQEPPKAPYHNTSFYSPALGEVRGFGLYKKDLETKIGEDINITSTTSTLNNFKNDFVFSADGSTVAVIKRNWQTAPGSNIISSIHIYKLINNQWVIQPSPFENLNSSDKSLGIPVAISLSYYGDILAVSTNSSYSNGQPLECEYGSIFIFEYDSFSEVWNQKGTEIIGSECDLLGSSIQLNINGDFLIASSRKDIYAYSYSFESNAWQKIDTANIELKQQAGSSSFEFSQNFTAMKYSSLNETRLFVAGKKIENKNISISSWVGNGSNITFTASGHGLKSGTPVTITGTGNPQIDRFYPSINRINDDIFSIGSSVNASGNSGTVSAKIISHLIRCYILNTQTLTFEQYGSDAVVDISPDLSSDELIQYKLGNYPLDINIDTDFSGYRIVAGITSNEQFFRFNQNLKKFGQVRVYEFNDSAELVQFGNAIDQYTENDCIGSSVSIDGYGQRITATTAAIIPKSACFEENADPCTSATSSTKVFNLSITTESSGNDLIGAENLDINWVNTCDIQNYKLIEGQDEGGTYYITDINFPRVHSIMSSDGKKIASFTYSSTNTPENEDPNYPGVDCVVKSYELKEDTFILQSNLSNRLHVFNTPGVKEFAGEYTSGLFEIGGFNLFGYQNLNNPNFYIVKFGEEWRAIENDKPQAGQFFTWYTNLNGSGSFPSVTQWGLGGVNKPPYISNTYLDVPAMNFGHAPGTQLSYPNHVFQIFSQDNEINGINFYSGGLIQSNGSGNYFPENKTVYNFFPSGARSKYFQNDQVAFNKDYFYSNPINGTGSRYYIFNLLNASGANNQGYTFVCKEDSTNLSSGFYHWVQSGTFTPITGAYNDKTGSLSLQDFRGRYNFYLSGSGNIQQNLSIDINRFYTKNNYYKGGFDSFTLPQNTGDRILIKCSNSRNGEPVTSPINGIYQYKQFTSGQYSGLRYFEGNNFIIANPLFKISGANCSDNSSPTWSLLNKNMQYANIKNCSTDLSKLPTSWWASGNLNPGVPISQQPAGSVFLNLNIAEVGLF